MKSPKTRRRPSSEQRPKKRSTRLSEVKLDALIREAVVDCYDDAEQVMGLFTMIEENLKLPFETKVLGVPVEVVSVDLAGHDHIIAVCKRGRERQAISLLDLPLPTPSPEGAEWIEAYRRWSRGR